MTVLNLEKRDRHSLFLGDPLGIQRYDRPQYPIFLELAERQQDFNWRHRDISVTRDRGDHARLSPLERDIFDANLRFQIAGDSMLSRSINALIARCTDPSLEVCMQFWAAFECIHSRSYTHILDNAYSNPTEFYDSILETPAIVDRIRSLREKFDSILGPDGDDRQSLFNAIVAAQIMEGVTFYVSFACSFYFHSRGVMVGNGSIIKLISRDENLHVAITQNILRIWRDVPSEGFQDIVKNSRDRVIEAYRAAVESEKEWAQYLFRNGALVGLTEATLGGFAEWQGDNRLVSLGLPRLYNTRTNPLGGWIAPYFDSVKVQVANQETDNPSYTRAIGTPDDSDFGGITMSDD